MAFCNWGSSTYYIRFSVKSSFGFQLIVKVFQRMYSHSSQTKYTCLTCLDTSNMLCLIYCDLWSGHCNYRGDGIGSSSSTNVSNIKQVERSWQQTSAGDFHFLFPKYLLLSSSYCSSHPLTYLCWGSH